MDNQYRWDELVFRDAPVSNNTTVSVSSANEKTSFNLSANYYTDQGMYIDDDYSKGGYNLNVSHKIYKNFTIRASNILYLGNRNNNGGMAYWRNPIYPVYNEDGTYAALGDLNNDYRGYQNPLAVAAGTNRAKTYSFMGSVAGEVTFLKDFKFKSTVSINYNNYNQVKLRFRVLLSSEILWTGGFSRRMGYTGTINCN